MTFDQLRSDLADLAQEVTIVDLRGRSLAASRRIGVRRAVILGGSAVALALLAVAGVAAMLRTTANRTLPPADPTPTVTAPATLNPSPTPTAAASPVGTTIDGTTFYFAPTPAGFRVYSTSGGRVSRHFEIRAPNDDVCVYNSLIVSPDGRWLAWVEDGAGKGDAIGTLNVARIDGTGGHKFENAM